MQAPSQTNSTQALVPAVPTRQLLPPAVSPPSSVGESSPKPEEKAGDSSRREGQKGNHRRKQRDTENAEKTVEQQHKHDQALPSDDDKAESPYL